ncbi:hypothetical protein NX02_09695 [Sphingomonas sanxanigenens DSM 19645 = NX02]|uniref:Uncharacterized protein n=1 Tax=Sphingomonas sanxanigenens DSM 19645 = NX02 TaxID=1123269 RepID=W0A6U7_9SPHN|nr:hypothetical protein NX02_09695 [Sphingomonas sanxanigenens DSM 19645 = NX02]
MEMLSHVLLIFLGIISAQHLLDGVEGSQELGGKRSLSLLPIGVGVGRGMQGALMVHQPVAEYTRKSEASADLPFSGKYNKRPVANVIVESIG